MQDQSGQTQVMQQQPQQQQMQQQSQMQQQQQQQNQQMQQQAMQVQQQAQQNSMQQQMQSPMQQQPQQQMQQQLQQQQMQQQPQQMQQQQQLQQQQLQQQPQQMQQQQQLQPQQQLQQQQLQQQQQQLQQQQPLQIQGQQLQGPLGSMPVQVQVIQQQPLQNAAYLPQFYNPQNGQIIMPSNLGVNPGGAIQVVANKSGIFQQAGPHILTQAGKQVLAAPGQAASFPGYTTIPTTTNQTLVISQLGVIPSQQNILPAHSTAGQQKPEMQKVQNAQPVQFSSWNFGSLPQSIAWTTTPQQPTLLTTQNANFIRGANPQENIQPKTSMVSSVGRPLSNILPSSAIRPASSVSTQTAGQQMTATMAQKQQMKMQRKPMMGRGMSMKTDPNTPGKQGTHSIAANRMILTSQGTYVAQTKVMQQQAQQQLQPQQAQQQLQPQQLQQPGQQPQLISFQQQQISFQPQQQQQSHLIQSRTNQVMSVGMPMTSLQQQLAAPTPQMQQPGQPQVMPVVSMVSNCQPTVTMTNQIPIQSLVVPSQVQTMPSPLPVQSPQQPATPGTPQKMEITIDGEKAPAPTPSTPSQATTVDKSKEGAADTKMAPSSTEPPPKMDASNDSSQVTPNHESGVPVLEDSNKERGTVPKAMVRPQQTNILTHVIEGYVIQEASQPFPVNRSSDANKENRLKAESNGEPLMKKPMLDEDYGACESCGKVDLKTKYKKKRSCSVCIKNKRNSTGKDGTEKKVNGKESGDGDVQDSGSSGPESSLSSSESNELANQMDTEDSMLSEDLPKSNPLKWTVTEVCEFIKNLPGCYEYAEDFALQEIDGQALMLLKEDHLMSAMSMKLGPALKIVAKIDLMRDVKAEQQSNGGSPEK